MGVLRTVAKFWKVKAKRRGVMQRRVVVKKCLEAKCKGNVGSVTQWVVLGSE